MRLFRDSESGSGLRRSESGGGTGNKLVSKVARAILPAGMMVGARHRTRQADTF
jgi:hypothetical protein